MVLMRKDVLYECVKRYVKKRKEDPYAFFTPSLRTRKFNFSCCEQQIDIHVCFSVDMFSLWEEGVKLASNFLLFCNSNLHCEG